MNDSDFVLTLSCADAAVSVAARHSCAGSDTESLDPAELQEILSIAAGDGEKGGRRLYRSIFRRSILHLFGRCLDGEPSRIVVELPQPRDPRTRNLHALPWENLHDGTEYLAARERSPVIRRIPVATAPVVKPEWPLRILLTTANPPGSPPLDLEREEEEIRIAWRELGSNVVLTVLRDITFDVLQEEYRKASDRGAGFYIWHHCGHGLLGEREDLSGFRDCRPPRSREEAAFELVLHGAGEESVGVDATQIGRLIADNRSLGLVVLNVCLGAAPVGLAPRLASLAVVNTVAFSRPVADRHAIEFASTLYRNLARASLDKAVVRCRQSIPSLIGNLVHYSRSEESWRLEVPATSAEAARRGAGGARTSQLSRLRAGSIVEGFILKGVQDLELDYLPSPGDDDGG